MRFGWVTHAISTGSRTHQSIWFAPARRTGCSRSIQRGDGQLGNIPDYDTFLDELDKVWAECLRVLVAGGSRVACVVGDICLSRRSAGRHHVLPLSADIQVRARQIGLDCLTPILWLKVANIALEASSSSRYLGKPNLPNGIVKNDIEHILFLRKPGGYRSPTEEQERRSFIPADEYAKLFTPIWSDVSGQLRSTHPAPYPPAIPQRLIKMFSFSGDTVLDPFATAPAPRHWPPCSRGVTRSRWTSNRVTSS